MMLILSLMKLAPLSRLTSTKTSLNKKGQTITTSPEWRSICTRLKTEPTAVLIVMTLNIMHWGHQRADNMDKETSSPNITRSASTRKTDQAVRSPEWVRCLRGHELSDQGWLFGIVISTFLALLWKAPRNKGTIPGTHHLSHPTFLIRTIHSRSLSTLGNHQWRILRAFLEKDRCFPSRGGVSHSGHLLVATITCLTSELATYWYGWSTFTPGHLMLVSSTDVACLSEIKSHKNIINGYRTTITENDLKTC